MATINTEAIWFRIIVVIVVGFFLALFIANAVFFDRIRKQPFSCTVTQSEADGMFWLNVIWAIIAAVFFVWSIVRLFWTEPPGDVAVDRAKRYAARQTAAAKQQLQRTDVGFGPLPQAQYVTQQPVQYVSSQPIPVRTELVQPPPLSQNLQRRIINTVADPKSLAPAIAATQGIRAAGT